MQSFIKIADKKFHMPNINFNQLDVLVKDFSKFIGFIQAKEFDANSPVHSSMASEMLLGDRLLSRLAAVLLVPEGKEQWTPDMYDSNLEYTGLLSPDNFFVIEDGEIQPAGVLADFLENNPILEMLLGKSTISSKLAPKSETDQDSAVTVEDSATQTG